MSTATLAHPDLLPRRMAVVVFLAFALAYFFSALVRAITATLSPTLTTEFSLSAQDLGLLAGGYFLGFSLTQLPLGRLLDKHGPKKVVLAFLSFAVLGCLAFSWADSFHGLLAARVLCGMGVSACLMAPLTGYRRWLDASSQLRSNSWMLMTGSLGMLAATLPVQWLFHAVFAKGKLPAFCFMGIGPLKVERHGFVPARLKAECCRIVFEDGVEHGGRNGLQQVRTLRMRRGRLLQCQVIAK